MGDVDVQGQVRFDGKPVEHGSIRFLRDNAGPTATSMIENGRYRLRATRGSDAR